MSKDLFLVSDILFCYQYSIYEIKFDYVSILEMKGDESDEFILKKTN